MPPYRTRSTVLPLDTMSPIETQRRDMLMPVTMNAPVVNTRPTGPIDVKRPGLLTRIGNSVLDRLAPAPSPEMASLLDPDAVKAARRGSLLQLGASLLQNSGWSNTPITLGQALGEGMQVAQQGYQQQMNQLANQSVQRQNSLFLGEQRMAMADERQANAEAKRMELQRVTSLMAKRPALYQGLFSNWASKTREEQQQVLFDAYRTALQNNDKETADAVKGMISSGNVIAAVPKAPTYDTVTTEQGVFRVNDADPTKAVRIGDRPRPASNGGGGGGDGISVYDRGIVSRDAKNIQTEVSKFRGFADLARSATELNRKSDAELTGVDGISVLYNFIRTMDPNAVKEGELQLAISSDPTLARFVQAAQGGQLLRGVRLSAPTIRRMLSAITNNVSARANTTRRNISGSVERISNIDPSYITPADTSLGEYMPATAGGRKPTANAASTGLFNTTAPAPRGSTVLPPPPAGLPQFERRKKP